MSDLSVEILKQIRDELQKTRTELSARTELIAVAGASAISRAPFSRTAEDHEARIATLEGRPG